MTFVDDLTLIAEFVGIVLLFFGLVDFSRWSLGSPAPARKANERPA